MIILGVCVVSSHHDRSTFINDDYTSVYHELIISYGFCGYSRPFRLSTFINAILPFTDYTESCLKIRQVVYQLIISHGSCERTRPFRLSTFINAISHRKFAGVNQQNRWIDFSHGFCGC